MLFERGNYLHVPNCFYSPEFYGPFLWGGGVGGYVGAGVVGAVSRPVVHW